MTIVRRLSVCKMDILRVMPAKTLQLAFGAVLREYRTRAGFSQEGLADAAGYDRTFIGMLERGQRQPTLETLFKIAEALDVAASTVVARTAAEWKE
jgi:transcriptional regulator with XRE-family HTH domain